MPNKVIGNIKFSIVSEIDRYIHNPTLRHAGGSFYFEKDGNEHHISLRNGKESFLTELSKYNFDNEKMFISKNDFDELKLFLKGPDAYVKAMDEFFEREQQYETEEKIMNERSSDEDYEAQKKDYNPDFDNFNRDDYDSSIYEAN